jgi:hypothetical protein
MNAVLRDDTKRKRGKPVPVRDALKLPAVRKRSCATTHADYLAGHRSPESHNPGGIPSTGQGRPGSSSVRIAEDPE